MTRTALVVGDTVADHLLPPLLARFRGSGWDVLQLGPRELADARVTTSVLEARVEGRRIDAAVFRLGLDLLVAPGYDEDDRPFVVNELRALWTHVLSLPTVRALNNGYAVSTLLRDPHGWRELLREDGHAVAPAALGASSGAWWLESSGGVACAPAPLVARATGALTVEAESLRAILCCCGTVPAEEAELQPVAGSLLERGLGLAEVVVDELDRVVAVKSDPPVTAADAARLAGTIVRWLDAPAGR